MNPRYLMRGCTVEGNDYRKAVAGFVAKHAKLLAIRVVIQRHDAAQLRVFVLANLFELPVRLQANKVDEARVLHTHRVHIKVRQVGDGFQTKVRWYFTSD